MLTRAHEVLTRRTVPEMPGSSNRQCVKTGGRAWRSPVPRHFTELRQLSRESPVQSSTVILVLTVSSGLNVTTMYPGDTPPRR